MSFITNNNILLLLITHEEEILQCDDGVLFLFYVGSVKSKMIRE